MSHFLTAVELRDQLDAIIALNPAAKIVTDVNGYDHAVLAGLNAELDHDGDARFTLRSYGTGADIRIMDVEEIPNAAKAAAATPEVLLG